MGGGLQPDSRVMLQTFAWEMLSDRAVHLNTIATQVNRIQQSGFDGVWLPPQSDSVDVQGYIPQRWTRLVNENSLKVWTYTSSYNSTHCL